MDYITRIMEKEFMAISEFFPVVLVCGPRQVGKTTMLSELSKDQKRTYLTLDDLDARALALSDPAEFFRKYPTPIIIDEVQYAPNLFSQIKLMADRNKIPGEFWMTGSQQFLMMKNVTESLAGRVGLANLYSLTLDEVRRDIQEPITDFSIEAVRDRTDNQKSHTTYELFKYILEGGMPRSINCTSKQRTLYFDTYINTYIMRDVLEYSKISDIITFKRFMVACAALTSSQLNMATLAQSTGISQPTAKEWLNVLQSMGIIYLLQPYSNNLIKRLVKTPKLYFYDTGLAAYLSGWIEVEHLQNGAMNGAYFENFVVNQFVKKYQYHLCGKQIFYYRDFDQKEIDLVLEDAETLTPIEIKLGSRPDFDLSSKFAVLEKFKKKVLPGAVVCTNDNLSLIKGGTLILPVWLT